MDHALRLVDSFADLLILLALRFALLVHGARRRLTRGLGRLRGSLAALRRRWLLRRGLVPGGFRRRRGAPPHNRTPSHLEEQVVRLHVEHRQLGATQLMRLARRILSFRCHQETIRRILERRKDLVVEMEQQWRRRRRRIRIGRRNVLWGLDLTLVMVLGVFPVWLLGVVDYHGSRLLVLQRCRPSTVAVASLLRQAFDKHGKPERLLSDNGPAFTSLAFELFLAEQNVEHSRIRPAHPWTNGRIERLFRTFKQEIFRHVWLVASRRQLDRFCEDFVQFYNRDRPHSAYGGKTPDEVYFGKKMQLAPLGRVAYFDGALSWYRFGT